MKNRTIICICLCLIQLNETKNGAECRRGSNEPRVECSEYRRCAFFNIFTKEQIKNVFGSLNSSIVEQLESIDVLESHVQVLQPMITEQFKDLRHVAVLESGVETVHKDAFAGVMSTLETLELSENILSSVEHVWLRNLSQLSHLYLDGNNISTVESSAFTDLTNLRVLHLELNSIRHLNRKTFVNCKKLSLLDLSNNKLHVLVLDFPNNALTYLDISNNLLWQLNLHARLNWTFKENSHNFSSTLKLIGENNNLKDVLVTNVSVHTLNLLNNPVRSLSFLRRPSYKNLIHLWIPYIKHLSGDFNWEEAVPDLVSIHIPSAQMQTFPFHLSRHISVLDLDANEIEFVNVTEVMIHYPRLQQIHLRDNDLPCDRLKDLLFEFESYGVDLFLYVGKGAEVHRRSYLVKFWIKQDSAVVCLTREQRREKHEKFSGKTYFK